MNARDIMSRPVWTTRPDAPLSEAARIMWDNDCGFVPVTDARTGELCGVLTDRDLCMASWTRGEPLGEITVGDVMIRDVHTCHEADDVADVHELMRRHQIRRVPIVDGQEHPVGVVSLNDLALAAHENRDQKQVALTLGSVCRHRALAEVAVR